MHDACIRAGCAGRHPMHANTGRGCMLTAAPSDAWHARRHETGTPCVFAKMQLPGNLKCLLVCESGRSRQCHSQ
eukprot:366131-Chlamydomonas_euryale.AAC.38